jgi:hypothetical protein
MPMLVHALHLLSAMQTSLYIRIQIFQDIHLLVRKEPEELRTPSSGKHIMGTNPQTLGRRGGEIPNYGVIGLAGTAVTCLF